MQKTNRKITNTNPSLAAIILNVNIKTQRQRFAGWIKIENII